MDELRDGSLSCTLEGPRLVKMTSTAVDTPFKKQSKDGWIPVFSKYEKKFKAKKLKGVLKSFVGRAKKKKPKITYLELSDDAELSPEFFSVALEGNIDFFPVPFNWEYETISKKEMKKITFKHSEALIVWRLSIVGSARDMGEDEDAVADDGVADQVADMLAGSSFEASDDGEEDNDDEEDDSSDSEEEEEDNEEMEEDNEEEDEEAEFYSKYLDRVDDLEETLVDASNDDDIDFINNQIAELMEFVKSNYEGLDKLLTKRKKRKPKGDATEDADNEDAMNDEDAEEDEDNGRRGKKTKK
ncbi:MAG: hypothetical protein SGARI_002040 [Bacillariaceae sp.]